MSSTSLPDWFWVIYHSYFLITIVAATFSAFRGKLVLLSVINFIAVLTLYMTAISVTMYRPDGLTELDVLLKMAAHGSLLALYVCACCAYSIFWWIKRFTLKESIK